LCGWDIDIKTREEFEAEGFGRGASQARLDAAELEEEGSGGDDERGSIPRAAAAEADAPAKARAEG
jgi:hypothetical protein